VAAINGNSRRTEIKREAARSSQRRHRGSGSHEKSKMKENNIIANI